MSFHFWEIKFYKSKIEVNFDGIWLSAEQGIVFNWNLADLNLFASGVRV